ncbi:hypothetical protein HEK616_68620 [Streptomyces nigrescens]|uniref:Uncharacterized protein n=1 Tax=Streptomyces nigrescens TaxID=1920 RepID=A0ABM8A469_STRNI|nr:hypothetical protein HEK616_68620 [Streptomyces nigrescens]
MAKPPLGASSDCTLTCAKAGPASSSTLPAAIPPTRGSLVLTNPAIPDDLEVPEVPEVPDIVGSLGMVDAFDMESTPQEGERYG